MTTDRRLELLIKYDFFQIYSIQSVDSTEIPANHLAIDKRILKSLYRKSEVPGDIQHILRHQAGGLRVRFKLLIRLQKPREGIEKDKNK